MATATLSVLAASSPALTFTSGKFSITTLDGSSRLSDTFTPSSPISSLGPDDLVRLESDEILRLNLVVPTSSGAAHGDGESSSSSSSSESSSEEESVDGEPVVKKSSKSSTSSVSSSVGIPEQIIVQLVNVAQPSKIAGFHTTVNREDGKVSWSQRVDRLPASLSAENPTYKVRLLLGSTRAAQPLSLDLGQIDIPSLGKVSAGKLSPREQAAQDLGFFPWEERRHTFRKEVTEDMPGRTRSLVVAAIIVIVPWIVLSGLLSTILPSLEYGGKGSSPTKISTSLLFLALFFLETLAYRYYRGDFVLFTMLPYFLVGAAVATAAILAGAVKGVGLRTGV
ncbi:hypothetical protein BCV69DRAFT_279474 [Microstroma glucosiphilum]|uniref:Dolichyl-diphosphooligosaccharide--protein glycosyltransferase subunit 2 n=1 Tax=Pseudomicrostroma glucosiphilum TaxID=1684307 RepID=A0A316UGT5_9BASI|nr:hypothetical protein BCV69DRAFT_279474 [Pseudomicrostroma glucosiphilum]PWN23541.1 hypothetical protein BCV69DRAFT_279474 [Pseudomicrostroma glucosiphilum]